MGRIILVLGGGAPNLTLMSGALAAFHDRGCTYDVISMAGGGAVVGLTYLAPKGLTPGQALRNTINFGISDAIYSLLPINYKIFSKGGPMAAQFRDIWNRFPSVWRAEHQHGMSPLEKLQSDMLLLAGAMASPTDVNYFSQAVCAHFPFIEQIVDFDRLRCSPGPRLFLNAYCMDTRQVVEFERPLIDVHHFRAALSFPFLYAPYEIDGRLYYEGAAFSCLNLINLAHHHIGVHTVPRSQRDARDADVDKFILFDILRLDLVHPARDLWDAYAQSVIVPLIADAAKELIIFDVWLKTGVIEPLSSYPCDVKLAMEIGEKNHALAEMEAQKIDKDMNDLLDDLRLARSPDGSSERLIHRLKDLLINNHLGRLPIDRTAVPNAKSYKVPFDHVPVEQLPYMLDWSRSNLERLFDIGYEHGLHFLHDYGDEIWG
jgi:NTE family protein